MLDLLCVCVVCLCVVCMCVLCVSTRVECVLCMCACVLCVLCYVYMYMCVLCVVCVCNWDINRQCIYFYEVRPYTYKMTRCVMSAMVKEDWLPTSLETFTVNATTTHRCFVKEKGCRPRAITFYQAGGSRLS